MKNLLLSLIATVLFAFNGNAQEKLTQEDVRVMLAQGMVDFSNALKPAFEKTENSEDFKRTVVGCWYSKMTKEGDDLLDAAYKLLLNKASQEEILKNYNGKEMAAAALYVDDLSKKGIKTDGTELFGGTTGDSNTYATLVTAKCRWYQLSCIIKEIFGEVGGETIMNTIIKVLVIIIAGA